MTRISRLIIPRRGRFRRLAGCFLCLALVASVSRADPAVPILAFSPPPDVTRLQMMVSPGDVNGDGRGDLLLGVWTGPAQRRALLYFGATPFDTIPDLVLDVPPILLGSCEGPTDLNGDGWPDIVVAGWYEFGEIRIFFGGPLLDASPDLIIRSPYIDLATFARSRCALDVNGDGFQDLVVGWPAPHTTPDASDLGSVWIYFGGPSLDAVPDVVLTDPPPHGADGYCYFGEYVHPLGDMNADGWPDLGVYRRACGSGQVGQVFVYQGGPSFRATPIASLPVGSIVPSGLTPWSFAPLATGGVVTIGHKIVTDGNVTTWLTGPLWRYDGIGPGGMRWPPDEVIEGARSLYGPLWADADLTGDGRKDLVIGGNRIFYAASRLDLPPDVTLHGSAPANRFGYGVTAVDVNGDGVAELLVSEPGPESYQGPGRVYAFDLSQPLPARAFVLGGARVIPLGNAAGKVAIELEPVGAGFSNLDVDLSSIELRSEGTGVVGAVSANLSKPTIEADTDGNGVSELRVLFTTQDLTRLFSSIRGRQGLPVALGGKLRNGRKLLAPFMLTVIGNGGTESVKAAVSPNPMNPSAVITLEMPTDGPVTARLYDASGRVVRTILSTARLAAGTHQLSIDGMDDHGRRLSSGVYFYAVHTLAGTASGRIVVAK